MRIAFAGGGTGGHVFPVQSLIKYIHKTRPQKYTFFWFGEKPSLEYTTYNQLKNTIPKIHFVPIHSGKRRREKELKAIIKNIIDLFYLGIGLFQSLRGLFYNKIDVIFCKGGYVSLPVVIAGWVLRRKVFLHESDTTPGLSNRICSKFASTIFTGFKDVFPGKEIVVGQILDDDLVGNDIGVREDNQKSNILITGGSQGSESVYVALKDILSSHSFPQTFFHIILGTKNSHLQIMFSSLNHVKVYDFVDQKSMGKLLNMCDSAITRGGTTSLAEQQLFGVKKVIIPIPWTHDQLKNAIYYKNTYGDILVEQDKGNFTELLQKEVLSLLNYKKPPYINPLESIHTTKEKILSYMV